VLGVRDQLGRMRALYPHFRSRVKHGRLVADGRIQPTSRSVAYLVRIEYAAGETPQVHILEPELKPREPGGHLPHVYPGDRLCLYLPHSGEWTPDMSLAQTVIPWIAEWLFFYETWRATGQWLGGGVEPAERKTITRTNTEEKTYDRRPG
jgi:hypothetical protein